MPLIAKNDYLIYEILKSDKHRVEKDGTCWIVDYCTKKWRRWDFPRRKGRNKKAKPYHEVSFKSKRVAVHRLVYGKFVGKLNDRLVINHKDGNPSNNKYDNLELITQSKNNFHAYRTLNKQPVKGRKKIDDETAEMLREQRRLGATYADLISMFGLCKSTISYVVNKRTWS